MDKVKVAQAIKVVLKNRAKQDYYSYVKYTHADFQELPHIKLITSKIDNAIRLRENMLNGIEPIRNQYIMISLPPRHGKSMTITETLPSYFMGKFPSSKVIMTAYSITLADDFARANAKKIEEYRVFNNTVVSNNQDRMMLDNNSVCVKAGIMGGITGKGAHLLIIDDPIKTQEEASSETTRNKIWKEWESSLSTRLEEAAIVILIMTRWHEDDLAGRLLNPEYGEPLPWEVVNIPLEAEENDILGRNPGEPLWDRYGLDFIKERKQYPKTFNALYQGRPSAEEGNIIKRHWWRYYERTPEFISRIPTLVLSVDATFKDSSKSDKVSIQVWGKLNANFYLVDRTNARMDFTTTLVAIRNMLEKYPRISAKYVEDKANGSAIINVLNKQIGGFIGVNPLGGKESRANSITPYIEAGNVYIPRDSWVNEFVEECSNFPNGKNDDDVDAMTQAISKLLYYGGTVPRPGQIKIEDAFFGKKEKPMKSFVDDSINDWG